MLDTPHSTDTVPSRLRRDAALALLAALAAACVGLGLQILLGRALDAESFGRLAYASTWMALLAGAASLGLPTALVRFVPEYAALEDRAMLRGVIRTARRLALVAGSAVGAVACAAMVALGADATVALAAALVPVATAAGVESGLARASGRAPAALGLPAVQQVATGGAVLLLVYAQVASSSAVLLITMAATIGGALVLRRGASRSLQLNAGPTVTQVRPWLRVSLPMLLVELAVFAVTTVDAIVVGTFVGYQEAGAYAVAGTAAGFVLLPMVAVNGVTAPLLAPLAATPKRLERLARHASVAAVLPGLGVLGALAVGWPWVASLGGQAFVLAGPLVLLLGFGHVLNAAAGPVGNILNTSGGQGDAARAFGICALVNVPLVLGGAFLAGATGAAAATAFTALLWNALLHRRVTRRLGIRPSMVFDLPRVLAARPGRRPASRPRSERRADTPQARARVGRRATGQRDGRAGARRRLPRRR
jgi:O-antigen/teichoic acid export membrane protein